MDDRDYNPADTFTQPADGIEIISRAEGPRKPLMEINIGDFIKIPAWRVEGCVINIRQASKLGSEHAQEVLLELKPDDPDPRWYRLEPGEFEVTS